VRAQRFGRATGESSWRAGGETSDGERARARAPCVVGATPFVVCRSANSMVRGPAANAFVPHRSFLVSSGAPACLLARSLVSCRNSMANTPLVYHPWVQHEKPPRSNGERAQRAKREVLSPIAILVRAHDEASILGHRTHLWLELLRGFSLKGAKELLSCPPYGCVSARVGCTTGNTGIRGHGSAQAILRWGWVQ